MKDVIKEIIKKQLSDKSKEELLDIVSDAFTDIIITNIGVNMQGIQFGAQKAIDAINADFKELVKNEIDTSASLLATKIREGGI